MAAFIHYQMYSVCPTKGDFSWIKREDGNESPLSGLLKAVYDTIEENHGWSILQSEPPISRHVSYDEYKKTCSDEMRELVLQIEEVLNNRIDAAGKYKRENNGQDGLGWAVLSMVSTRPLLEIMQMISNDGDIEEVPTDNKGWKDWVCSFAKKQLVMLHAKQEREPKNNQIAPLIAHYQTIACNAHSGGRKHTRTGRKRRNLSRKVRRIRSRNPMLGSTRKGSQNPMLGSTRKGSQNPMLGSTRKGSRNLVWKHLVY